MTPKIVGLLSDGNYWRAKKIAEALKVDTVYVGISINSLRKHNWPIVTGLKGYTLRPRDEDFFYESALRLKTCLRALDNGINRGARVLIKAADIDKKRLLGMIRDVSPEIQNRIKFVIEHKPEEIEKKQEEPCQFSERQRILPRTSRPVS